MGIFGHKIEESEIIEDTLYKMPKVEKTLYQQIQGFRAMVQLMRSASAVVDGMMDYKPVFGVDLDSASCDELFNIVTFQVDKFSITYDTHLHATIGSNFANGLLYWFLMKQTNQDSRILW